MKEELNVSIDGEPIQLCVDTEYIVIDPLYLSDIKEEMSIFDMENAYEVIKERVFPYTSEPFAEYKPNLSTFSVDKIKYADPEEDERYNKNSFDSDSGLVIFCNKDLLQKFIVLFDYDELVESDKEIISTQYWRQKTSRFSYSDFALILAPGIDSGYDFVGSGTYTIK